MRTLLCRAHCSLGGEPEVPFCYPVRTAYRLPYGASCYATGHPRVLQPCFGKFFFGFVADPSGSAVGARPNHGHAITCAAVDLTSTPVRWRHSGVKNRQMTLFLALLNEHEPTVDRGHRRCCIVDLLTVEADPALIDRAPGIAL